MPPRATVVARSASASDLANDVIDKFFGQNLFNQFLLNQINPVNIISYKFAGNGNILKSCYFFEKLLLSKK